MKLCTYFLLKGNSQFVPTNTENDKYGTYYVEWHKIMLLGPPWGLAIFVTLRMSEVVSCSMRWVGSENLQINLTLFIGSSCQAGLVFSFMK